MGYRQRCELHIYREDDRLNYAMLRPGTKEKYTINSFPAGSPAIQIAMPKLLEALNTSTELGEKLFRVDFLSSLSGELCITLVYHRPLGNSWELEAELVRQRLGCRLIGRSRKQKTTLGGDFVTEQLAVYGKVYRTRQTEGSFTQPNALVNREMLEWAVESAEDIGGDLLELYCGNGNFTLPLATKFDKVLATEISKTSIAALEWGMAENQVSNIVCARLSAEEACSAIKGERPFRRLSDVDLDSYNFTTLFVDPPRAGLDEHTLDWAASFDNIIYVSCNPETLAQNLAELCKTHVIERFACFDQFPFTPHLEVGVKLTRK